MTCERGDCKKRGVVRKGGHYGMKKLADGPQKKSDKDTRDRMIARRLLSWYRHHRRDFPWRVADGALADPYAIWISEIMLQQTSPKTATPYYQSFLQRWPNVDALAKASLNEVLHAWQGLGYYARARALHQAAKMIVRDFSSRFPDDPDQLRQLPGIGDYTAGAIAAIAFNRRAVAIDTNVRRVLARLDGISVPSRRFLHSRFLDLSLPGYSGDTLQGMIELGAQLCKAHNPSCSDCCWRDVCQAHARQQTDKIPEPRQPSIKKKQYTVMFWVEHQGRVRMRRRPGQGLLASMSEFPSTLWRLKPWTRGQAIEHAPGPADWHWHKKTIRHLFSHIDLDVQVASTCIDNIDADTLGEWRFGQGFWVDKNAFDDQPLPVLMRKVIACCPQG